jgi:YfiR/HmsC-like
MPILIRARSLASGAVIVAALAWPPASAAQRSRTVEADVKAAFLFNFTKFVEWPATAPPGAFRICTIADGGFDAVLARTLAGESTDGRQILRVTPEGPEFARGCHILFVSRQASAHIDRWMAAVNGQPVLVVGESQGAEDAGAHITFVIEDNRVKFDVNDDAASRAGLRISSKLLRVARQVTARSGQ